MVKIAVIVGACAATTLLAAQSFAGTITGTDGGVTLGLTGNSNNTVTFSVTGNSFSTHSVGMFNWTSASYVAGGSNDPTTAANWGTSFTSFCIQGNQSVTSGTSYLYTINSDLTTAPEGGAGTTSMSVATANTLAEFWDRNYSTSFTAPQAAAFQLGIWEIVYDGAAETLLTKSGSIKEVTAVGSGATAAYNFSNANSNIFTNNTSSTLGFTVAGTFDGTTLTDALGMLNSVTGTFTPTPGVNNYTLVALESSSNQDQLTGFAPTGVQHSPVVPLPAALPVGGAMLSLMGVVAGYRKRRNRA